MRPTVGCKLTLDSGVWRRVVLWMNFMVQMVTWSIISSLVFYAHKDFVSHFTLWFPEYELQKTFKINYKIDIINDLVGRKLHVSLFSVACWSEFTLSWPQLFDALLILLWNAVVQTLLFICPVGKKILKAEIDCNGSNYDWITYPWISVYQFHKMLFIVQKLFSPVLIIRRMKCIKWTHSGKVCLSRG
jgi:hypothetical protein